MSYATLKLKLVLKAKVPLPRFHNTTLFVEQKTKTLFQFLLKVHIQLQSFSINCNNISLLFKSQRSH